MCIVATVYGDSVRGEREVMRICFRFLVPHFPPPHTHAHIHTHTHTHTVVDMHLQLYITASDPLGEWENFPERHTWETIVWLN